MDKLSIFLMIMAGVGALLYVAAICIDLGSKRDKKNEDDRDRDE